MESIDHALRQIEEAFAEAPRPPNEDLLHPNCFDDNDVAALYEIRHWRDMSDAMVENEYAAPAFLSPAGFRHFLPAYLSWMLRHPDSGAAVVQSTLMALSPAYDGAFRPSKFELFDEAQ